MRCFFRRFLFTVSTLALGASVGMAQTTNTPAPDQVEEDWKVVLATPDTVAVGPQAMTCMCPFTDKSKGFVAFDLNYLDHPSWRPGGLQVKAYGAAPDAATASPVLDSNSQGSGVCELPEETIAWTQRMKLSGGKLNYNVVDGQSTTWGNFGQGQGTLGVSMASTLSDLSAYKPDYSLANSGVSWQSNRVASMTLLRVRYYSGGRLISTDSTERTVDLTPGK